MSSPNFGRDRSRAGALAWALVLLLVLVARSATGETADQRFARMLQEQDVRLEQATGLSLQPFKEAVQNLERSHPNVNFDQLKADVSNPLFYAILIARRAGKDSDGRLAGPSAVFATEMLRQGFENDPALSRIRCDASILGSRKATEAMPGGMLPEGYSGLLEDMMLAGCEASDLSNALINQALADHHIFVEDRSAPSASFSSASGSVAISLGLMTLATEVVETLLDDLIVDPNVIGLADAIVAEDKRAIHRQFETIYQKDIRLQELSLRASHSDPQALMELIAMTMPAEPARSMAFRSSTTQIGLYTLALGFVIFHETAHASLPVARCSAEIEAKADQLALERLEHLSREGSRLAEERIYGVLKASPLTNFAPLPGDEAQEQAREDASSQMLFVAQSFLAALSDKIETCSVEMTRHRLQAFRDLAKARCHPGPSPQNFCSQL